MNTPRRRSWLLGGALGVTAGLLSVWTFRAEKLQPVTGFVENPSELYALAESQIAAFRRNDFPAAYTFAASGIREKFPLEAFSAMVRQTYPHLTRSGRLSFGETQFAAHVRASALIYVNSGGAAVPMIYAFVREEGKWKIEGVQMLRSPARAIAGEPRV